MKCRYCKLELDHNLGLNHLGAAAPTIPKGHIAGSKYNAFCPARTDGEVGIDGTRDVNSPTWRHESITETQLVQEILNQYE
jgi:hypothetical protein